MNTADELGVVACPLCELVMRAPHDDADCPRCGERLSRVSRRSLARCWALVIAAAALYFPANVLPMMNTEQFPMRRSDTILSGIKFLWSEGSWELAALVFAASILVPLTKLFALGFLLVTSARRSTWRPRVRTKLYRALEVIGHWSMLDVFVVSLLTAVVQLGRFASVEPGPAVLPFASVVVLTMLASASFDPRTIWAGVKAGASDE
jgi:paraquat-inducible protein A